MYWANFINIGQPLDQTEEGFRRVVDSTCRGILGALEETPSARLTVNLSGWLTEHLARHKMGDVIDRLGRLAERGQVELTAGAMYNPFLPLIPADEVKRQIELNTATNRRYFGDVYSPKGFFPPEMGFSHDLAKTVASLGFDWILADEISYGGQLGEVRTDITYLADGLEDFRIFFKERRFSRAITEGRLKDAASFSDALMGRMGTDWYLLTGANSGAYGRQGLLRELLQSGEPKTVTISELSSLFPANRPVRPLKSSWTTWEDEMADGVPYPQWRYPGNTIHDLQWELTRLAIDAVGRARGLPRFDRARALLDEGLNGDHFWWASCRPGWSPALIERGVALLMAAVIEASDSVPREEVLRARQLAAAIRDTAARWQRMGLAEAFRHRYISEREVAGPSLTFGPTESETA